MVVSSTIMNVPSASANAISASGAPVSGGIAAPPARGPGAAISGWPR